MAILATPTGVTTSNPTGTEITVSWGKGAYDLTKVEFGYKFVSKGDASQVITATSVKTAAAISGENIVVTLTFDSAGTVTSLKDYIAEVQAKPKAGNTADTASLWGKQRYWIIGPTLTITIGDSSFTLSQDTFAGATSKIYKLPVSKDNPLTITYTDIEAFATSVGIAVVPTEYPDGTKITGALNIYELVVDAGNALFALDISVDLPANAPFNTLIPGLKFTRVGLSLKRTDGSL
jgi:hypothetical protein